MRHIRIHDNGFTLLEVLIAVAILSIGVVSVIRLFSDGLKTSYALKGYTEAIFHARNIMEEAIFNPVSENGKFDDGCKWEKTVSDNYEGGNVEGLKQINVLVSWKDGVVTKKIMLSTLKVMFKTKK
ncbi:MAG: prepilin-type N-terminal cleavage/methylation domain-containing protein [Nitrospirae bacterium]|nr:prepilin-type N-terminal cleavage/methylation domain-containing protein [Nitrospirota bacterium]